LEWSLLLKLYPLLCLQMNFFRPVRKLIAKERSGAKVAKRYDAPRTPYQRLRTAGVLAVEALAVLEKRFLALNPAELQKRIDQLLHQLWETADRAKRGSLVSVG
jgi:hypothetical protein